ncbi:MAG: hypothetical protein LWX83_14395 [Anaerolineae bacterium]|nr:hypothetical protein [Anaerolineae bacterium]
MKILIQNMKMFKKQKPNCANITLAPASLITPVMPLVNAVKRYRKKQNRVTKMPRKNWKRWINRTQPKNPRLKISLKIPLAAF